MQMINAPSSGQARYAGRGLTRPCLGRLSLAQVPPCDYARNNPEHEARPVQSTLRSFDLAHLAHVELLTPKPEESLRFFVDVFGMTETARQGQSVYLRGWDDYEHHTLKLTEG